MALTWRHRLALLSVFTVLFANSLTMTLPFPFLYFMIKDFGYHRDEEVGYYAGLLASMLFLGRAIGSYPWGYLLDRIGRRPVVLMSLVLITALTVAFGLCKSLAAAIVVRMLSGFFNVLAVGSKTCIAELCGPELQAKMMTSLTIAWGVGLVAGASTGGLLCQPADKYESMDIPLFREYPYLLPCLAVGVMSSMATLLVFFFLPETLPSKAKNGPSFLPAFQEAQRKAAQENGDTADEDGIESQVLVVEGDTTSKLSSPSASLKSPISKPTAPENKGLMFLLRDATVVRLILLYGTFSFAAIALEELFSIFFATPVALGGLGWSSSQIGWAMTLVGAMMMSGQYFIYPVLDRKFKPLGVVFIGAYAAAMTTIAHPCLNFVARAEETDDGIVDIPDSSNGTISSTAEPMASPHATSTVLLIAVVIVATAFKVSTGCSFTAIAILMNNSVTADMRGKLNGLGMTCTALFRTLGPSVGGSIFSWSVEGNKPFPFNAFFAFIFMAVVFVSSSFVAKPLPKRLNLPKE